MFREEKIVCQHQNHIKQLGIKYIQKRTNLSKKIITFNENCNCKRIFTFHLQRQNHLLIIKKVLSNEVDEQRNKMYIIKDKKGKEMPTDQMHWRVAYSVSRAYNIIASSNININPSILLKLNSNKCIRYTKKGDYLKKLDRISEIREPNGLATIFGYPGDDDMTIMHVLIINGNALDAMNQMIELLDEKNAPNRHLEPIIKFNR